MVPAKGNNHTENVICLNILTIFKFQLLLNCHSHSDAAAVAPATPFHGKTNPSQKYIFTKWDSEGAENFQGFLEVFTWGWGSRVQRGAALGGGTTPFGNIKS